MILQLALGLEYDVVRLEQEDGRLIMTRRDGKQAFILNGERFVCTAGGKKDMRPEGTGDLLP